MKLKSILLVGTSVLGICASLLAEKPIVVTTTTMVTDMVKDVGGDDIEIVALMGPGVDPHLYKPSARDISLLRKADVIFYNGLMLEGRMADVFAKMARRGAKVYAVTEEIEETSLLEPPEFEGHWDPHVWFDVELWAECIPVVVTGLSDADPEHAKIYEERGKKLAASYQKIGEWAQMRVAEIPEAKRVLITSHDAFNYFGRSFGFEVVGVQGISTATEAGLADISETVDFIKEKKVPAIFVETSVSPATIKRISEDSGAVIGGELFSDAMGTPGEMEQGSDGETYDVGTWPGMVKHNVNTIVDALK
ncbi:metal ABC transporter solute-binding protein, Zn/Mn family [Rubellicoccus peritrichatus]|uniref:Zinc ABC transporter substrate-binding protein n=1 Tax=Rubellicoccus peritrichatus TaxID=3080537 RepID=A0AAQ3LFB1_9BACT|nr:zinc ABC transporter substrate-binding protein [Puniceicoccus sp. CR14]WOO40924.1 zinc ABC transporter substrate-binding protein [Puniceicoccus sp. CR14]